MKLDAEAVAILDHLEAVTRDAYDASIEYAESGNAEKAIVLARHVAGLVLQIAQLRREETSMTLDRLARRPS